MVTEEDEGDRRGATAVDFGKTAPDYARHRRGFPEGFYERLDRRGLLVSGHRALDVGTGTGTVARALATRGMEVTGLDTAPALLAEAERLAQGAELRIDWIAAPAERTGLGAGAFDLVTAAQCWHWFDRDRAAAEARRVLRPGGAIVIAHLDWLENDDGSGIVAETCALIRDHNPAWPPAPLRIGRRGLYPQWLLDLDRAGFVTLEVFSIDTDLLYTPGAWRGRVRASAGVSASLPPAAVARFDDDLAAHLADRYPPTGLRVPHRVFAVVGRRP